MKKSNAAKFIYLPVVKALALLGVLWTIIESSNLQESYPIAGFLAIGISLLLLFTLFGIHALRFFQRTRYLTQVFGLSKGVLTIVPSTYEHVIAYKGEDPCDVTKRYKKRTHKGAVKNVFGAHDYVVGLKTLKCTADFIVLIDDVPEYSPSIIGDQELLDEMQNQKHKSEATYICIGSPNTNVISELFWDKNDWESKKGKYCFDIEPRLYDSMDDDAQCLSPDNNTDYAVLAKTTYQENTFFFCVSIGEEGTLASFKFLLSEWRYLGKTMKDCDFFLILKVDKLSLASKVLFQPMCLQ